MVPKIDPITDMNDFRKMATYIQMTLGYNGAGTPSPITLDSDEVRTLGWIAVQI